MDRAVCVYCGSSLGGDPAFEAAARTLGTALAEAGLGLVYGGGGRGLMGTVARSAIAAGGRVRGFTPDFLVDADHALREAQDLVVVPDMHARKRLMFENSDAFVALPGGIGTLEELVEQMTWVQLARHAKPVLVADICGFWGPLLTLLDHMRERGFVGTGNDVRYLVANRAEDVVPLLVAALDAAPPEPPLSDAIEALA